MKIYLMSVSLPTHATEAMADPHIFMVCKNHHLTTEWLTLSAILAEMFPVITAMAVGGVKVTFLPAVHRAKEILSRGVVRDKRAPFQRFRPTASLLVKALIHRFIYPSPIRLTPIRIVVNLPVVFPTLGLVLVALMQESSAKQTQNV